jgi:hypothetical protein
MPVSGHRQQAFRPDEAMHPLHTIRGACHCGNLSYELRTRTSLDAIRARACDCSFCRMHAARNWSDPEGKAVIRIRDVHHLQRYRFGLRTADFLLCTVCGAYLGAVLSAGDQSWSTVNLRLSALDVGETGASYGSEDTGARIARRQHAWTPTAVIIEPDPPQA